MRADHVLIGISCFALGAFAAHQPDVAKVVEERYTAQQQVVLLKSEVKALREDFDNAVDINEDLQAELDSCAQRESDLIEPPKSVLNPKKKKN